MLKQLFYIKIRYVLQENPSEKKNSRTYLREGNETLMGQHMKVNWPNRVNRKVLNRSQNWQTR